MGIWRFAGAFAVAQRRSECGSKNLLNARQPPMRIGVCYVLAFIFLFYQRFQERRIQYSVPRFRRNFNPRMNI